MTPDSKISEETRKAEQAEARTAHEADRPPTADEESLAEQQRSAEGEEELARVAEHFEEMTEIGAHVKGEGAVD